MPTIFRFLCAWLLTATALVADVELKNVSLHYGTSPRMLARSWAFFNYRIVNRASEDVEIEVILRPAGQRNVTIYTKTVTIPADSDLRARMLVTVGTVEDYDVELFRNGNLVKKEAVLLKLGSPSNRMVYFVNDELDLEYGNFAKNKNLDGRYKTTFVRADSIPEFWNGYDNVHILVLMRPDYATMSQRQMDAIVDYVARGGTVLFNDPHGIVSASQTRLGELLNLEPLRIRQIETLTALQSIGAGKVTWDEGEDMLEAAPLGEGITTLWEGELPLLRWSRYGLGTVGCMTVNPSQRGFRADEVNFDTTWNHILAYGGHAHWPSSQANDDVVRALDTLIGIPIPEKPFVSKLLGGFVLIVLVVIGVGTVTRRQLTAWLVLAGISVVATISLFAYGQVLAKDLAPRSATVMHFRTWGQSRVTGDQLTSLMSRSQAEADLIAPSTDVRIRSLTPDLSRKGREERAAARPDGPPGSGKYVETGSDEVMMDPIRIDDRAGISMVKRMHLPERAPKSFAALYSREQPEAAGELPSITWTPERATLADWPVPPELTVTHAIMLNEAGFTRLLVSDGVVRMPAPDATNRLTPSPEIDALQQFLHTIETPAPCLVLFGPAKADGSQVVPADYEILGRVITLVPIRQVLSEAPITVPQSRVVLEPRRSVGAMLIARDGTYGPAAPLKGDVPRSFLFDARLPAGHSSLQVSSADVHFVPDNRGGNIRFSIQLRPYDATDESRDVEATSVSNDTYHFENLPDGFVNPATGVLQVVVTERQQTVYTNAAAAIRPNSWVVQEIKMAVTGSLPASNAGQL